MRAVLMLAVLLAGCFGTTAPAADPGPVMLLDERDPMGDGWVTLGRPYTQVAKGTACAIPDDPRVDAVCDGLDTRPTQGAERQPAPEAVELTGIRVFEGETWLIELFVQQWRDDPAALLEEPVAVVWAIEVSGDVQGLFYVSAARSEHGINILGARGGFCEHYPECGETCNTWAWCAVGIGHSFQEGSFGIVNLHIPREMLHGQVELTGRTYYVTDFIKEEAETSGGLWYTGPNGGADTRAHPRSKAIQVVDEVGPYRLELGPPARGATPAVIDGQGEVDDARLDVRRAVFNETPTHLRLSFQMHDAGTLPPDTGFGAGIGLPSGHVLEMASDLDTAVAGWAVDADYSDYHVLEAAVEVQRGPGGWVNITVARDGLPPIAIGDQSNLMFYGTFERTEPTGTPAAPARVLLREGDDIDIGFIGPHRFAYASG